MGGPDPGPRRRRGDISQERHFGQHFDIMNNIHVKAMKHALTSWSHKFKSNHTLGKPQKKIFKWTATKKQLFCGFPIVRMIL